MTDQFSIPLESYEESSSIITVPLNHWDKESLLDLRSAIDYHQKSHSGIVAKKQSQIRKENQEDLEKAMKKKLKKLK